jgi:flagellar assembly factor FliW
LSEIYFPEGLVGCKQWQHFTLDEAPDMAPLALLHSHDVQGLSLIVTDPWLVYPTYAPVLDEADRVALAPADDSELKWLTVLTLQNQPLSVTANLLGPLVVNRATGSARQVVLAQSGYQAAHLIAAGEAGVGGPGLAPER